MIYSSWKTLSNYLYKLWKQPVALFFKRTATPFLIGVILTNKSKRFSNERLDLFIKYLFRPILCEFLLLWRHLLLSYTLWLLKISFLRFRSSHRKVFRKIFSWNKWKNIYPRKRSWFIICFDRRESSDLG